MTASSTVETTTLKPSYAIPITLIVSAVPLILIQIWIAGAVSLFGLFLLYQTVSLRLIFTATDLDIYRGETRIRRFPYKDWSNWEIFWSPVPILFYFREVNSIHFLPIIFNPAELRSQLDQHFPKKAN